MRKPRQAAAAQKAAPKAEAKKPDLRVVGGSVGGQNSTLSDDELAALFFQHKRTYEAALEKKKLADAELRNAGKKAKADLGEYGVLQIKTAIELESDEGAKKLKERMEREYQVARWLGLPLGAQADLFGVDRRPADEIAENEGFQAGAAGLSLKVPDRYGPSTPNGQAFAKGWHKGQESIFAIKEKRGEPLLREGAVTEKKRTRTKKAAATANANDERPEPDPEPGNDAPAFPEPETGAEQEPDFPEVDE